MALITHTLDSLVGGVSQQPAIQRLPSQCEVQENALGTVIEGLKKRPPTEHVGVLTEATVEPITYHTINRDSSERYVVSVQDQRLRVFDFEDTSLQSVLDINGDLATTTDFSYLATSDPEADIEFLTIADATLVLNKSVQPKMSSSTTTDRGYEALAFVKQGNYGTKYTLEVEGRSVTYTSEDGDVANHIDSIQTDYIASILQDALTSGATTLPNGGSLATSGAALSTADFDIEREGSTIWIKRDDGADFAIKSDDSVASSVLAVIKDSVQTFSVLPTVAPNGFTIKVDGLPDQGTVGSTAYYVKFETDDTSPSAFGDGQWEESVAGGIEYQLDYATMPHLLVRLSTGQFLFTQVSGATLGGTAGTLTGYVAPKWGELAAGDQDSNPRPAFVQTSAGADGEKLRGMSFFKDRLVMLVGETVVLSEVGQYFNFFRTTVTDLLDSARMSVVAASTRVNLLNYAVALRSNLVLFSGSTQFVLTGDPDGTLTPTNVSAAEAGEYESTVGAMPVASENSIFFVGTRGANTQVRELYDTSNQRPSFSAVDITGQVPSYIVGATKQMEVSTTENCLALRAGGDSTIYIYKWMINGGERIQSAWSKFTFGILGVEILNIDWVDEYLYLIVRRGTETCLERINFEPFFVDSIS